jgi:surfeit locus 1 family protein
VDYPVNARRKFQLITVAALLGVAITMSLGRWQLSRAAQKEQLQAAMDAQSDKLVVDAAALRSTTQAATLLHQRALLRGTWVPERTVFLDNRQMNARVGFFVMTPLRLEGGGVILVQRGWVPRNFTDRAALPAVDTPAGLVQIEGRMAPPPSKLYEPGTSSGGAIRQNVDLVQLSAETGLELLPVTLRQTGAASEGMDRQWPAADLGVDKHYGYAFQWFGLSALIAGLYLWFQVIRRFIFRSKDPLRHVQ